ncbi:MAG: dephospho-CoA kinase [Bdellovibrionota bacterium]
MKKAKAGTLSTGKKMASPVELWGLTGGVAAGKSLVAQVFREAGIPVINADEIAAELRRPGGAAHGAIIKRFGTADRAKLRETVFTDATARRDLEAIMHPLIQTESMNRIASWIRDRDKKGLKGPLRAIYEAALLVETKRHTSPDFAGLLVVEAPIDLRRLRLMKRDGLTSEMADQIMKAQISDDARRRVASHVFVNDGGAEDMRTQVLAFIRERGWGAV